MVRTSKKNVPFSFRSDSDDEPKEALRNILLIRRLKEGANTELAFHELSEIA